MTMIKKHSQILYRIIAATIIFCMTFETAAVHVYAAGYEIELIENPDINDSNNNPTDTGTNLDIDDKNGVNELNKDTKSNEDNNMEPGTTGNSDETRDESSNENETPSENNEETESNKTDKDTEPNEGGDTESSTGDDTESSESNNDTESSEIDDDTESDAIKDGFESDQSVDDKELNSNNENSSNRTELTDIPTAEKAFTDIVSTKDVMALIYMTDIYHVRRLADAGSDTVADLESGHTVYLLGVTITHDKVWFKVQFWAIGTQMEGYVERGYLAYSDEDWLEWDASYLYKLADNGKISQSAVGGIKTLAASYTDVAQFPAGYQAALTQLKSEHSNWIFVPMNTNLDFATAVTNEMGVKSLIQNTTSNASKGWVGSACPTTSGWYYATRDAVTYYMDPRNFLTETYIFQFEQLTFNESYHTVDTIQSFLNSTFMKGIIPDDSQKRTYAQAFYEIGSARKLSPIHLAARVYQEQGQGNSDLISGTYSGYEGYYNYFNVNANGGTDKEVIESGLAHAKKQGWNTRYKSLEGGAATIGNNYILKGQDTIYLEKFNVDKNSPYGLYEHQYMQNIQAPASESSSTRKMYSNSGSLNSAFVFKIPVYNNMSDPKPLIGISLDKESLTLRRPDTVVEDDSYLDDEAKSSNMSSAMLQVIFNPVDTTDDKTIVWTSSNKKVATVENGIVTAVSAGEAIITATASDSSDITAQCKVTVIAPVYKIEFPSEYNTDTILLGQSTNLYAEYFPKDTTSDTTVQWTSSDTSVIIVNNKTKGTVRGVGVGTAEITATIGGYSASHRITVEGCNVTFMDADNTTSLMTFSAAYGETISQESFDTIKDIINSPDDSIFIGWYTGTGGTGSRFTTDTKIFQKDIKVYPYFIKKGSGFYVIPIGDQTYTGSAIKPEIIVYDIAAYENFDIEDDNTGNSDADDSDIDNSGADDSGADNSGADDSSADNSSAGDSNADNFDIEDARLVLNRDYTVSYKNNKKAAYADAAKPPTITIKGKGNYAGTQTITFNIVPKALTNTDITFDNITAAYTGKAIKGNPTLYRNGKKLIKNTDYKLTYPQTDTGAYQNEGTYPIIVTGNGGYSGTITVYETITKKTLLSKAKIAKIPAQVYDPDKMDIENGIGIEPPLTVTYKKSPLTASTDDGVTGDYIITYKNNYNIGTATATITAVDSADNPYIGSKSITFKITGTPISKAVIEGVEPKTYTGMENDVIQDPEKLSVSLAGEKLKLSTDGGKTGDYVLEYKNNNKAGTATVIVKGINKYSGTKKATYKITACDLSQINMSDITIQYYTEGNEENIQDAKSLNDIVTPYVKGGAKPTVLLFYKKGTDNEKELIPGNDYTIKYKNNKAVTTNDVPQDKLPLITITGKGLYKGSISGTFRITDGAMSDDNGKIKMTANDVVYKAEKAPI